MPTLQTPVVRFPYPLILHTPNAHPDPAIQLIELARAGSELSGEVADGSPDHPVDLQDHLGIEVVTASGERPVDTRGLTGPLPCDSSTRLSQVCPLGLSKKETSTGHVVVPEEREPRMAPRSPPRHIHTSALAL